MRREQKLWKDENWDLREEMFKRIKVKQEEIRRKKMKTWNELSE